MNLAFVDHLEILNFTIHSMYSKAFVVRLVLLFKKLISNLNRIV